jgi:hypothetical protein
VRLLLERSTATVMAMESFIRDAGTKCGDSSRLAGNFHTFPPVFDCRHFPKLVDGQDKATKRTYPIKHEVWTSKYSDLLSMLKRSEYIIRSSNALLLLKLETLKILSSYDLLVVSTSKASSSPINRCSVHLVGHYLTIGKHSSHTVRLKSVQ